MVRALGIFRLPKRANLPQRCPERSCSRSYSPRSSTPSLLAGTDAVSRLAVTRSGYTTHTTSPDLTTPCVCLSHTSGEPYGRQTATFRQSPHLQAPLAGCPASPCLQTRHPWMWVPLRASHASIPGVCLDPRLDFAMCMRPRWDVPSAREQSSTWVEPGLT